MLSRHAGMITIPRDRKDGGVIDLTSTPAPASRKQPAGTTDDALMALMQHVESSQVRTTPPPTKDVMSVMLDLYLLLRPPSCVCCRRGSNECAVQMNCYARRYLLKVGFDIPLSRGWCQNCDLRTEHTCAYLELRVPNQRDLDVCDTCLWPLNTPEYSRVHRDAEEHAWFARNVKSTLGVYLTRKKPYGLSSWHDLVVRLNTDRRIPQLSSGQLLADLHEYLTVYLGLEHKSYDGETPSSFSSGRADMTFKMEDVDAVIAGEAQLTPLLKAIVLQ